MTRAEAIAAAFELVAARRPGSGAAGTSKRRAWVQTHGVELRAELARLLAVDRPPTLFDAEAA